MGRSCLDLAKPRNRCTGQFCDFLLDWEDELPEPEFERALKAAQLADLVVCLGTSLQIEPVGSMPLKCKRKGGKVVTVNLQHTALVSGGADVAMASAGEEGGPGHPRTRGPGAGPGAGAAGPARAAQHRPGGAGAALRARPAAGQSQATEEPQL